MMKRKCSVNLFLVFCVVFLPRDVFSAPSQQFPFGVIEGVDVQAITSGKTVYAYYGIPFAEPPVGPLRFRPPVPYAGRNPNNVISSNSFRASCMQEAPPVPTTTSEDCLHLNIFAPSASSQTERKVMVWIHGGGYILGDVRPYTPTDLVADYDVVVVTIHYRLGFFGFMSTGDEASPGNNGLRDQVLALQWVKDNIRAFGGDPDDVTLFGESAGAGSVSFLSLSPYSKGLFTKAIMQSGTVFSPWSIISPARARSNFYKMAGQLNCLPWWYLVGRHESPIM
ncbi:acetylcholinesterase-like [Aplysia californica]|uniref:Carboxylic ester hydrolase n=1 Tax=Aplysia californica TaxID=6500 RepID=A0ABM1AB19_APLCA|nr:acetylcholinesterase-like [Aplysia californica]